MPAPLLPQRSCYAFRPECLDPVMLTSFKPFSKGTSPSKASRPERPGACHAHTFCTSFLHVPQDKGQGKLFSPFSSPPAPGGAPCVFVWFRSKLWEACAGGCAAYMCVYIVYMPFRCFLTCAVGCAAYIHMCGFNACFVTCTCLVSIFFM